MNFLVNQVWLISFNYRKDLWKRCNRNVEKCELDHTLLAIKRIGRLSSAYYVMR